MISIEQFYEMVHQKNKLNELIYNQEAVEFSERLKLGYVGHLKHKIIRELLSEHSQIKRIANLMRTEANANTKTSYIIDSFDDNNDNSSADVTVTLSFSTLQNKEY